MHGCHFKDSRGKRKGTVGNFFACKLVEFAKDGVEEGEVAIADVMARKDVKVSHCNDSLGKEMLIEKNSDKNECAEPFIFRING